MKRNLFVLAGLLLSSFGLFAQKQIVVEHDYAAFDAISATDYFEIAIVPSDDYSVKITTDYQIEDYILAYVKDGVLTLTIDEKGMPSDIKKEFKARSSAFVPVAQVCLPNLKSLTISGNSVLNCERTIAADSLSINLGKTAIIKKATVEADNLSLNMTHKSQAYMTADAMTVDLKAIDNSRGSIKVTADSLRARASNYANFELYGSSHYVSLKNEGNAKVTYENSNR